MKFFIGFALIAVFAAGAVHAAISELEPSKHNAQQGAAENLESLRIRKAARSYGAAPSYSSAPSYGSASTYSAPSYAPPPCPKNYLFSCQPNLQPVPCAQGYQGAYSEQIAQWAAHPQKEN